MRSAKRRQIRVRTPRQERALRTVEAILGATTRVLIERGYAGTTTNHIAERAGVSVASFYEYFENKDAAIAVVAEKLVDKSLALTARWHELASAHPPVDSLGTALRRTIDAIAEDGPVLRVLHQQVPFVWELPKVKSHLARLIELARGFVVGEKLFPADALTEDRLYFLSVVTMSFVTQLVVNPDLESRRDGLIREFLRSLDSYRREITSRAPSHDGRRVAARGR